MALTRLWFIRHGEVEAPYVGTFTGSTDVGLSEVGEHQAAAIAGFLRDAHVDTLVSSPQRRALATAAPLAASRDLEVVVRDDLREMDFGTWETKDWPRILEDHPEEAQAFQDSDTVRSFPGGEDTDGFCRRVHEALDGILDEFAGRSVAVFAHAGTNRAILSRLTGMPYLETFVFAQDYGCVNAAGWDTDFGHGQVAMLNVVPGPPSEDPGDGGRRLPAM